MCSSGLPARTTERLELPYAAAPSFGLSAPETRSGAFGRRHIPSTMHTHTDPGVPRGGMMTNPHSALSGLGLKMTGIVPVFERKDEEGQTLVEYGLIIALIAVVAIAAMTFLSGGITGVFSNVGSSL
jgi:pilus assembly protein Flp/PilA